MDLLPPVALAVRPQPTSAPAGAPQGASFKAVLNELAKRMDQGETAVHAVTESASSLGPSGALLGLQAGVYRYTETFEVAAKLVDKASSAVKTTLQGQ